MQIEVLSGLPLMDVVIDMQRDLSLARSEAELVYHFAARFGRLTGAVLLLDLDIEHLPAGQFRLRDRIAMHAAGLDLATMGENNVWDKPTEEVAVSHDALISRLITGASPKLARAVAEDEASLLRPTSGTSDALAVPVYRRGAVRQWLVVFLPPDSDMEPVQVRTIISTLNIFSRAVVHFRLHRRNRALKKRLALGLSEVARIQRSLLPEVPALPGLEIAVHYRPSSVAGGDYYDFRTLAGGKLGIVIADVAGHGPGAAVVMAMLRTIMSSYRLGRNPPESVVPYANRLLSDGLSPGAFVTAIFVIIDPVSGSASYFNCGHCAPRIARADGAIETLTEGGGPPLGILEELDPASGSFELATDDRLLLYTDGIIEAPERSGPDRFGYDRLDRLLADCQGAPESLARLAYELDNFSGESLKRDDECVLMLRKTPA